MNLPVPVSSHNLPGWAAGQAFKKDKKMYMDRLQSFYDSQEPAEQKNQSAVEEVEFKLAWLGYAVTTLVKHYPADENDYSEIACELESIAEDLRGI